MTRREAIQEIDQDQDQGTLPAVQVTTGFAVNPALIDQARSDAGRGLSKHRDDNLIPMVKVLQPMSPEVNAKHPSYVEGAEPGAFLLKNSPIPVIPGNIGFQFVPAAMELSWVEWRNRNQGGGFVAKHPTPPDDMVEVIDQSTGTKKRIRRESRNELEETRYRYGLILLPGFGPLPFAIPFKGTGHTVCRAWETQMNSLLVPDDSGESYPSFVAIYHLTTRQRTNAKGTWFQIEPRLFGESKPVEYNKAKAMLEAYEASSLSVDESQIEEVMRGDEQAPF